MAVRIAGTLRYRGVCESKQGKRHRKIRSLKDELEDSERLRVQVETDLEDRNRRSHSHHASKWFFLTPSVLD